jgi:hypothetical protein
MLRFRRAGHDLQAHVALGDAAAASTQADSLAVLDSLG